MELNITYPTVNIITGTTPTLVAMEMMELLAHHDPIDRHKVAFMFLDTQLANVPLAEHVEKYKDLFYITALPISAPPGLRNATRFPQDGDPHEPHTFIGNWIPFTNAAGAGGIRNNGHVALAMDAGSIRARIIQAMNYVQQRLDGDSSPAINDVYVNIVTFLGGGTGSGSVNDLASLVQDIGAIYPRYVVRVQVHGLLPAIGAGAGYASDRKMANCTAALLELLALSMASQAQPTASYTKWLRNMPLKLTANQNIASGVYLYGQGRFGSTDDMARALGLTLYLMATNSSGVGKALAAGFVDHVGAIARDDRGLPTLFGSNCTLAVRVPTRELSHAFAYKMSEHLLDKIINGEFAMQTPEGERRDSEEWDRLRCQLVDQASAIHIPAFSLVQKAPRFQAAEFRNANDTTIRQLKNRAERQREDCKSRIHDDWTAWIRYERELIQKLLDDQMPARHKMLRLQGKMQEYADVIRYFSNRYLAAGPAFPDDAGQEVLHTLRKNANAHEDACEDCARDFNTWQDDSARSDRSVMLIDELRRMVERFQPQVSALSNLRIDVDGEKARLRDLWRRSPGREGRLERPHLFQSSLFDTPLLRNERAQLIEQTLFEAVTYRLSAWPAGSRLGDDEADQALARRCVDAVGAPPNEQAASRFVDKIVGYFTAEYLTAFDEFNVFETLRRLKPVGPGTGRTHDDQAREIEQILTDHLAERLELVESRYAFVPGQAPTSRLGSGFYIGAQATREDDKQMFRDIVGKVTLLGNNLPPPTVSVDNLNPHVIEVSLDEYGITMSIMPDFNYPIMTMMYHFLNMVQERQRGANPIPDYTSAAVERLIEDPNALLSYSDPAEVPQLKKLYDRVIR